MTCGNSATKTSVASKLLCAYDNLVVAGICLHEILFYFSEYFIIIMLFIDIIEVYYG